MTLGEYVSRIVSEKDLSYRAISKVTKGRISPSYMGKIISGDIQSPSIESLQALAKGLGVAEEEIFRVARGLPIDPKAEYNSAESKLLRNYRECSREHQKNLEVYADYLRHLSVTSDPNVPDEIREEFQTRADEE